MEALVLSEPNYRIYFKLQEWAKTCAAKAECQATSQGTAGGTWEMPWPEPLSLGCTFRPSSCRGGVSVERKLWAGCALKGL